MAAVPPQRREGERSEHERSGGGTAAGATQEVPSRRTTEVSARAKRRTFSASYKLRILEEADACEHGELGHLLRREGLYSSHLSAWRRQREQGALNALGKKRGRKLRRDPKDRKIEKLERERDELRRRLEQAEQIIEIQKKVSEILVIPLKSPDDDESDS